MGSGGRGRWSEEDRYSGGCEGPADTYSLVLFQPQQHREEGKCDRFAREA